jgi:hypothetical protein
MGGADNGGTFHSIAFGGGEITWGFPQGQGEVPEMLFGGCYVGMNRGLGGSLKDAFYGFMYCIYSFHRYGRFGERLMVSGGRIM